MNLSEIMTWLGPWAALFCIIAGISFFIATLYLIRIARRKKPTNSTEQEVTISYVRLGVEIGCFLIAVFYLPKVVGFLFGIYAAWAIGFTEIAALYFLGINFVRSLGKLDSTKGIYPILATKSIRRSGTANPLVIINTPGMSGYDPKKRDHHIRYIKSEEVTNLRVYKSAFFELLRIFFGLYYSGNIFWRWGKPVPPTFEIPDVQVKGITTSVADPHHGAVRLQTEISVAFRLVNLVDLLNKYPDGLEAMKKELLKKSSASSARTTYAKYTLEELESSSDEVVDNSTVTDSTGTAANPKNFKVHVSHKIRNILSYGINSDKEVERDGTEEPKSETTEWYGVVAQEVNNGPFIADDPATQAFFDKRAATKTEEQNKKLEENKQQTKIVEAETYEKTSKITADANLYVAQKEGEGELVIYNKLGLVAYTALKNARALEKAAENGAHPIVTLAPADSKSSIIINPATNN